MAQQPPHMRGVVTHPGDAPDDLGDAVKGPQVGVEAVGLGPLQQGLLSLLELGVGHLGARPGAPRLCRPAVPSACQRWCQRLTVWRETPRVRATSAWWTSWANNSAACRRRSWNACRSRRSAVGLRRVAIGSCSYHDISMSPYTAKLFKAAPSAGRSVPVGRAPPGPNGGRSAGGTDGVEG